MSITRQATHQDARKVLREATHAAHVRLNRHPLLQQLTSPDYSLERYRQVIKAYFSCYGQIETAIDEALSHWKIDFDYSCRRKHPWLLQDMAWFGISPPAIQNYGKSALITDEHAVFGVLYTIEGSSLGGRLIAQCLSAHFGLTPQRGARFFSGYGENIDVRWSEIVSMLNVRLIQPGALKSAIRSANDTFQLIEACLDEHCHAHTC
jgi:heme oxygenase (biliverdin-IX-beta and delta-forming)